MNFEVGQEVVVKKALRLDKTISGMRYYHGGDLTDISLGTKGVVDRICYADSIYVKFENGDGVLFSSE